MPTDIKITTEMLFQGALMFAVIDAVYVPILLWRVEEETFRRLRWPLAITAGFTWLGIWAWAIRNFRDSVYAHVFPGWSLDWIPWVAGAGAALIAPGMQALAVRWRIKPVLSFCLMAGLMGSLTHTWAVYRGLVTKPPMLAGASPFGAITIAFFEYMFYWCTILVLAVIMQKAGQRIRTGVQPKNPRRTHEQTDRIVDRSQQSGHSHGRP